MKKFNRGWRGRSRMNTSAGFRPRRSAQSAAHLLLCAAFSSPLSHFVFGLALVVFLATGAAHAAAQVADQTVVLDAQHPGPIFEGVGAVSGGGATSVLLKDYPEPQRSQILDILFKPKFAASMQVLYAEVGGDGNSTQGTEPTHMRSRTEENDSRGYEWWLMREAKQRNPDLSLDACAWSCPAWVGNGNFWSQDMCDYYVHWIKALKSHYGLDLDAIGCRNERGSVTEWAKLFRKTLDANGLDHVRIHAFDNPGNPSMWDWLPQLTTDPELAKSIDIISNHCLTDVPQPLAVRDIIARSGKPVWDTEEHVYNEGARSYPDDFAAALGAVHLFNTNYIEQGATRIVNWYLVGSTYPVEPYYQQPPAMFASSPWSGHYALKPIIWSYAHYGQFTKIGWRYVESGCRHLSGGGTMVTLKGDGGDFSIIAETAGAAAPQTIRFQPDVDLSHRPLCVWRTTRDAQFARQADIPRDRDGSFSITLDPDAIYSLSITTGQSKGQFDDVPVDQPFPLPYRETFNHYAQPGRFGYLPHYTADIVGVFEISPRPDHAGTCLRQVVDQKTQSWAPEWKPYTVLGDPNWTDYEVSCDINFDDGGWAGVMGRISSTGNGWTDNPEGYYAKLAVDGKCGIFLASGGIKSKSHDRALVEGVVPTWHADGWHALKLRLQGPQLTLLVDGRQILSTTDDQQSRGVAGLITGGDNDARNSALFANLCINRVNGPDVPPTTFEQDANPIYGPAR